MTAITAQYWILGSVLGIWSLSIGIIARFLNTRINDVRKEASEDLLKVVASIEESVKNKIDSNHCRERQRACSKSICLKYEGLRKDMEKFENRATEEMKSLAAVLTKQGRTLSAMEEHLRNVDSHLGGLNGQLAKAVRDAAKTN